MGSDTIFSRTPGPTRRSLHAFLLKAGLAGLLLPTLARSGAQREEPLADSVRTALSAAIAERLPPGRSTFNEFASGGAQAAWWARVDQALRPRLTEPTTREEFIGTVWYEASRAALEPALVLGLIEVESGFRKYAISSAGARGYMQVMPFWARLIGDGDESRLFHLQTNLRFGCVILRHYLDVEKGELSMALGRYNGSRGQDAYPQAVWAARARWV